MRITIPALRTAASLALALAAGAGAALAHHGWAWTTGGDVELSGVVREARLGNPHGVLRVDADGERWRVEVGQPWRNARAGLTDALMAPGAEITAIGEPSADLSERRLKAERLRIGGETYELYPERD